MLLQLRVENHRSLKDEQTLSFIAVGNHDPSVRHPTGVDDGVLPAVAVYGANASGKSNVLNAAIFLRRAVLDSHRHWLPGGGIPVEPFALGGAPGPSVYELDFLVDGTRHRYGFAASVERVEEEWLYRWPQNRKQTLFEREADAITFGRHLAGENEAVRAVMRPNSLFLSAAAQNNHALLSPLFHFFMDIRVRGVPGGARHDPLTLRPFDTTQLTLFEDERRSDRASLLNLLQAADTGITDVRVEGHGSDYTRRREYQLWFEHRGTHDNAWLPLEAQSSGTRTLLDIGALAFPVLRSGAVLCVDELEASLHPMLAYRLVRLFQDPQSNPRNAQLLFTTHDTNLIGTIETSPLRRDQIWFTEKDQGGATKLYPLSDFKPRKDENLERGYLQGRYGAIPFLGDLRPPDSDR